MRGIEVEEIGYTISVDTTTLIAKSFNVDGVKVQIQPIDASSLNNLFYDSYNLNGKFSYSYYDSSREKYFFKKIRRRDKYKTDTEYLIEGARWLQDNDLISDRLYDDIYAEVLSENDSSEFGGSVMSKSAFNPYYLGDKYLSTFEVLFENTTEEVRTCNTVFLLKTDKSSLEPLSSAAICSFQKQGVNIADIEALERYGYSNNIVVPPNSKITKYMAFLPVDLTSKKIELFFTTHSG
ncbi:MAG TPA: hypothetical protein VEP89_17410, partial [Draconibacterium sp.]|nr:hypothetical protein [Draconibacterium sp.]